MQLKCPTNILVFVCLCAAVCVCVCVCTCVCDMCIGAWCVSGMTAI